ncbi:MAG TPA: methyltransferase [Syntrophothermus lipocalidus]|uniref:MgtC/SapB transporter n=1 Tax=Syntrophothermus lipocalidus (strain DSM 12680 / TGB-C1) TaxID=643648 RepID=D7CM41_SYNLT|nr:MULTISPECIES: MgtC/SapB family protein [Syntrophothermus]ADI01776.1 MgtC/SapB transporter [Syntrophothermus lipocalidus DSM 12680]NSW83647.1 MgtC/SapB family protein [Syntrophothermus sp.]HHV77174.1 methyltransferase [Syntrophothermus lipocalidus]
MSDYEIILKLALACFLGGVIGLERESLNRPAGLRTYTLVCMGSALAMIVSLDMYYQYAHTVNADPGRIAAQVVSGIGFLGAGTIMREGANIRGLTTAAGLWVVACIGLAVGAGMYLPAVITTGLILFVLVYFVKFEEKYTGMREYKGFLVVVDDKPGQVGRIGSVLGDMNVLIKNIQLERVEEEGLEVELLLQLPPNVTPDQVADALQNAPGCREVERLN